MDLRLRHIAIGSLPHKDPQKAMELVERDFCEIPFFPQLTKYNKNEDMIIQFLEGMPSFFSDKPQKFCVDLEDDSFLESLENFYSDYEEIINNNDFETLKKYKISKNYSSTFELFTGLIRKNRPLYAKGQIVGPFTLATSLKDKYGNYFIYDATLKDVVVKLLSLKALWQIMEIKSSNPDTVPIIFMDEPSISQIGSCAYLSIDSDDTAGMLKQICQIIKKFGGVCAVHCCGKCDWNILLKSGVDILNLDAYNFSQNFSIYHNKIQKFLLNGGKIAWGIVPTVSDEIVKNLSLEKLVEIFDTSLKYLTNKGVNEKLIINNSLITSSCGAGSLSVECAIKAMDMVYELGKYLNERYKI